MPKLPANTAFRIGRSRTGLGLFATKAISKGDKIIRYRGRLLDARKKSDDIENKYLFEINSRWTIDGSARKNVARYINHSCRPNAESDVNTRKRRVVIRAIRNIQPGDEIYYDYGKDYFNVFLKPIGCKCDSCVKKRAKLRAEERAARQTAKKRKAARDAKKIARNGSATLRASERRTAKNSSTTAVSLSPVSAKPMTAKPASARPRPSRKAAPGKSPLAETATSGADNGDMARVRPPGPGRSQSAKPLPMTGDIVPASQSAA